MGWRRKDFLLAWLVQWELGWAGDLPGFNKQKCGFLLFVRLFCLVYSVPPPTHLLIQETYMLIAGDIEMWDTPHSPISLEEETVC